MPHIVMEYSDPVTERVNVGQLLEDLHQTAVGSGIFDASDVKSRAYACHDWLVGERKMRSILSMSPCYCWMVGMKIRSTT